MFQINKSSSDFWNSLKLTWQLCADLPSKYFGICVAELDGKVYAAMLNSKGSCADPFMYDSKKDQWSKLPALPYTRFSLVTVPDKKELLAIGGKMINYNGVIEISHKVFVLDKENRKWTIPYPNMPTARFHCSSISHGSTVIVAGGVSSWDPWTMTRAVEVLHIKQRSTSYWSVVEQLSFIVYGAIPLIVNDKVYITVGFNNRSGFGTCNVVIASLPELLQSSNKNTSSDQVWNKLPDMPYSSHINHYQGRLTTFGGFHGVEQPGKDKPVYKSVPLIHTYNPYTNTWDCVGEIPYRYLLGMSVHIRDDKILFIGGLAGSYSIDKDDMITACSILTLSP